MILTCPQCATRYLVDDGQMRPEGRKVKCAACGEEWRVSAQGENERAPAPVPPEPLPLEPPLPEPDPPAAGSVAPVFEVAGQEETPPAETVAVASEPPVLESLFVAPINTDSKPAPSTGSGPLSNLLLGLVILAVLGAAAFAFRMEIVRIAPKTAPIYSALGMPMSAPPAPPSLAKPPPQAAASPHG